MAKTSFRFGCALCWFALGFAAAAQTQPVLEHQAAMGDWRADAPGVRRIIRVTDLPAPHATPSVDNGPRLVGRPPGALPKVPPGFKVDLLAEQLNNPRKIVTAPNGDLFVAESEPGRIKVLRQGADGKIGDSHRVCQKPASAFWHRRGKS